MKTENNFEELELAPKEAGVEVASANDGIMLLCDEGCDDNGSSNTSGGNSSSSTPPDATTLTLGVLCNGCINSVYDYEWFKFVANGERNEYTIYTTGYTPVKGTLYDANGLQLASDSGDGNVNFSITKVLTSGATYYVKVEPCSSTIGGFTIVAKCVEPVAVTGISISPAKKYLCVGETTTLNVTITPGNADNKVVRWTSRNTNIATVGYYQGLIEAKSPGTTIITATTADGGFIAECELVVAPYDKTHSVIIRKDDHSFQVEFKDGHIWKNIGCDLNDYETDKTSERDRMTNHNLTIAFTESQLASIFSFDPLGVGYYIANCNLLFGYERNDNGHLLMKDRIYELIFGVKPILFTKYGGNTQYYDYAITINTGKRSEVFSYAESIFGAHRITNIAGIVDVVLDIIDFLEDIFESFIKNHPVLKAMNTTWEIGTTLFYFVVVGDSSAASSYLLDQIIGEETINKVSKIYEWPKRVYDIIEMVEGLILPTSLNYINIYNKVNTDNFITIYLDGDNEITLGDVVTNYIDNN